MSKIFCLLDGIVSNVNTLFSYIYIGARKITRRKTASEKIANAENCQLGKLPARKIAGQLILKIIFI